MDAFECLVSLGERKKLIRCSKLQLIEKICQVFDITDGFELQTYNSEYEDWVETEVESLEPKTKVKIVLLQSAIEVASETVQGEEAVDLENITIVPLSKVLPRPYRLPKFPPDLEVAMTNTLLVTTTLRRRVIQTLFEDIIQYTMYPNSREYSEVCALLIYRYPKLSDKTASMKINVRPYESWHRSLVTKFKAERHKIRDDEIVNEMRRKHASVRKAAQGHIAIIEKRNRHSNVVPLEGENEETISSHAEEIRLQSLNEFIDGDLIDDRMIRTKSYRQALYTNATIVEVLEIFPCLKWHSQLIKDCQLFFKENITNRMDLFFNGEKRTRILSLLKHPSYDTKIKTIDKGCNLNLSDIEGESFLVLLPLLFKENPLQLIKKEPGILPCIVPVAAEEASWFGPNNSAYYVCADHTKVCEVKSFREALEATLAIIFLFNIQHPKSTAKTLSFLSANVCELEEPSRQYKGQIALVLNKIL